ncbi:hypothetical protein GLOTRDRAFT_91884 [Gloeophyllum trabeum ATCC 11539]|uniref:Uncharacterized protein n=1 Tax=Gloeophyllum trabeum (strain ATCC 11539 / FP-39264 / Madison 617) TaxID=670483 RepID=S7QH63_GLOTA|nr:uncharacterized protein GLOTRDRAFT_91884 [Gloeophyllum trabeum ATCC 11539]EPQ58487.1 hypothetical protein GLOTRDRAFT_91884 [Gloeophyllum trabeum ATCC 11539]
MSTFMQCPHPNCDRCLSMPKMIQAGPQNARPAPTPKAPSVFKSLFKRERKEKAPVEDDDGIIDAKYDFSLDFECQGDLAEVVNVRAVFTVQGGEKSDSSTGAPRRVHFESRWKDDGQVPGWGLPHVLLYPKAISSPFITASRSMKTWAHVSRVLPVEVWRRTDWSRIDTASAEILGKLRLSQHSRYTLPTSHSPLQIPTPPTPANTSKWQTPPSQPRDLTSRGRPPGLLWGAGLGERGRRGPRVGRAFVLKTEAVSLSTRACAVNASVKPRRMARQFSSTVKSFLRPPALRSLQRTFMVSSVDIMAGSPQPSSRSTPGSRRTHAL